MIRLFVILVVMFVLALSANPAKAGTLDRGVQIGPFFMAGGSPGNPMITQLKYQMAIDTRVGLKNRYTTKVYNNYDSCSFLDISNYSSGTVSGTYVFGNTGNTGYIAGNTITYPTP